MQLPVIGLATVLPAFWSVAAGRLWQFWQFYFGQFQAARQDGSMAVGFGEQRVPAQCSRQAYDSLRPVPGKVLGRRAPPSFGFGYVCGGSCLAGVPVVAWPPNSSFKPTPLRGAA